MLDYLKKFTDLPAELKQKVSNQEAMAVIEGLEKKYQLPLASFIMRVMVKEIALADLALFLLKENLTEIAAGQLAEELKEKIFFSLGDYLSPPADPPILPTGRPAQNFAFSSRKERSGEFNQPVAAAGPSDQPLIRGVSFFFSPDDEQEIGELAKKISLAKKTELPAVKIEEKLEAIINRAQINFGSADLAARFKQILKTYLRGIRNKLETELTLIKPFAGGGLSFDEDSAQKVMAMADKIIYPVKSPLKRGVEQFNGVNPVKSRSVEALPGGQAGEAIKLSAKIRIPKLDKSQEDGLAVARDAPYDFSKLAKAKKSSKLIGQELEDVSHELAPLTPVAAPIKLGAALPVSKKESPPARLGNKVTFPARPAETPVVHAAGSARRHEKLGLPAQAGNIGQMPLIRRRFEAENLGQSQKVKVEDVKYVPRVMSPLDEIKYLDLISFRRLDKDPSKAIDKIKTKINLLEEEGYDKRLEGVKFWRSSPINQLYLEIGHLSISENKPIDVIIEERKIKVGDYLTAAEFKAIMDLNKSLRF